MQKKLALILLAVTSLAHASWTANTKDVADTSYRKSFGNFGAQLLLVNKGEFAKEWDKPGIPHIKPIEKLKRLDNVTTLIIFSGCKEIHDACNVSVDYTVTIPNQKPQVFENQPLWTEKSRGEKVLMLGRAMMENHIEQSDPLGIYVVDAIVHDNNAHIDLKLSNDFKVVK